MSTDSPLSVGVDRDRRHIFVTDASHVEVGLLTRGQALEFAYALIAAAEEATEEAESDDPCGGSGRVRISTGRWSYTAPCPSCHPEDFAAREVDGDHFIIGPAVAR